MSSPRFLQENPTAVAPGETARTAADPSFSAREAGLLAAMIAAVIFVIYFPALRGGFVWDDDAHVTAPALRSAHGLWRIWAEPGATQQYYPVLHSAFWFERRLWGDATFGYHGINLALHATAAFLFAILLRRLAIPGAFLAALLFAAHPVHVESVAWISEQKNTLSTIFYLAAALAYLRYQTHRAAGSYLVAFLFFVLALGTKTVTATLPAALLITTWWQRGRIERRDITPLLPWFLLGAGAGLFTAWIERKVIGAEGAAFDLSALERTLLAGRIVWFYLGKIAWPANLTFIYPRWHVAAAELRQWLPLLAALALAVVLVRGRRTAWRAPLAAIGVFVVSLLPVLGFVNVYPFLFSFVADHFQYLASLPIIALAAAGLTRITATSSRIGGVTSVGLVGALAVLAWQQSAIYRDAPTLYRATIARNADCWMAHNNLGKELLAGKTTQREAIACFERALDLRPAYFEARNNLGLALTQTGRPAAAIPHLEAAIRLKPQSYQAHNNLGIALASHGRASEALHAFGQASALNPSLPNIQENWAKALLLLNRRAEADAHFALAARLRSTSPVTPSSPTSPPSHP